MLLKHVEGSGSRHGLPELQGLPQAPHANGNERSIVDPADVGEPARESQQQQHRAEDCADGKPRRRTEQQRRGFHADPTIVLPILKRVDRIVSDRPAHRRSEQAPGRRFDGPLRGGPGHDGAPAEGDPQYGLRDVDDAFRKGVEAGQEDGDRAQEYRERVKEQHEHSGQQEKEADDQQGMCDAEFTRCEWTDPRARDMSIEGSIR